jgi:hypothetical protein
MNQESVRRAKGDCRHYCRHCRGKLETPTGNHREAFDSQGCFNSFYLHRCVAGQGGNQQDGPNVR